MAGEGIGDDGAGDLLVEAASAGDLERVRAMVEAEEVNVEARGSWDRRTAFVGAAASGHVDVMQYLVDRSASVNAVTSTGETALLAAAWNGTLDVIQLLIDHGTDVDAVDGNRETALMRVALGSKLNVVRCLLDKGADVNAVDSNGETALMRAVSNGSLDVVQCLVDGGADVNATDNSGWSMLVRAVWNGNLDLVQYLLDKGVNVNAVDNNGETPLLAALSSDKIDIVKYLVDSGADVNAAGNSGETVLMRAVWSNKVGVVQHLLVKGAMVNAVDDFGRTALRAAASIGNLDIVQDLEINGADVNAVDEDCSTPLLAAVSCGSLEVVKYLVDRGASINAMDKDGISPLLSAASSGNLAILQLLLDRGADIDAIGSDGSTALMRAVSSGSLDVVRYLADKGANVNAVAKNGERAITIAALTGKLDIMQFLVDKGADVNAVTDDGRTALMLAAQNGELGVVRGLVDRGVNVNAADQAGWTALILAAQSGELEVAQQLAESGADVNAATNMGETSMMQATRSDKLVVVQFLAVYGADVNSKNHDGRTALMIAAQSGYLDIVEFFVERGVDLNAAGDNEGRSLLMHAVLSGDLDIVQFLVKRGADVGFKTVDEQTATIMATQRGYVEIRSFLLQHLQREPTLGSLSKDTSFVTSTSVSSSASWGVSPFDIELIKPIDAGSVGGEFIGKWLDADVVVKLFVSDASTSSFADEVTVWHQLRHPNVIKLYGACDVGHSFFVLEHASNGPLVEYLNGYRRKGERATPWRFLYEAALGLAYLHERKIVHGNLRSSNILVGSDGVAKLSDFGLTVSRSGAAVGSSVASGSFGSVRYQAPEQLKGEEPSFAADIYSFGLCVMEGVTGRAPWETYSESSVATLKDRWDPESDSATWEAAGPLDQDTRLLLSRVCAQNPNQRITAALVARIIEGLGAKEATDGRVFQPKQDPVKMSVHEYRNGALVKLWSKICDIASQSNADPLGQLVVQEIEAIQVQLSQTSQPTKVLDEYHSLLVDLSDAMVPGSYRNRVAALSSTRATNTSLTALRRRVSALWAMLDCSGASNTEREQRWDAQRKKQLELFVSEISQTMVVLSDIDGDEERSAFISLLKSEIDTHASDYTTGQLAVMKKALAESASEGPAQKSVESTPVWFLPWYELVIDKMKRLGEGGFGDVYRAKWLDSEVVVKQVKRIGESTSTEASSWSMSMSQSAVSTPVGTTADDIEARRALRVTFEREVNVWFDLSHPHVVRLFGACHIGTPFFACEFAGYGSLDKFLRLHPDELWTKLHEAALGIQYLQSRGIIHGDLKCNNVVIGNDGKAKVTDFGLSSLADDEDASLTGAWQWVAPECIEFGASKRSFASDVYALGMCVVEALRVAEFGKLKKVEGEGSPPLPWGSFDNTMVKHYVTQRRELPLRPELCTDEQWKLVERMCVHNPTKRIKIGTVVDELAVFARGDASLDEAGAVEPESESLVTAMPLSDVITEMKEWIQKLHDEAASSNLKVLCRVYQLLWQRLECLVAGEVRCEANVDAECLRPLVERTITSTRVLPDQKDTLFAFTETALRGYALHRGLDKVIDAQFWQVDGEGGHVHHWRPTCLSYLEGGRDV